MRRTSGQPRWGDDTNARTRSASAASTRSKGWLEGDREVLDLINTRRRSGSKPNHRDDDHHLILVVEGGGMRGVYVAGMIRGLFHAGARDAFDEIYAVSAGAFSSCGFIAGHVDHSVSVYCDQLTHDFVDFRRWASRRGPLISIDYLVEDIMNRELPFDWTTLTRSDIPLRPIATDLATGQAVALTGMESAEDWQCALRASAAIPVWAESPVEWRGRDYVDGFVADALPLARAIAAGASHVLALVARGAGERPAFAGRQRREHYADSLRIITDAEHPARQGGQGNAKVLAIRPTHSAGIGAITTNSAKLWRAGEAGEDAARLALSLASTS